MIGSGPSEGDELARLLAIEEEVDAFMARKGVFVPAETDVYSYMTMTRGELDGMAPDDVGVAGFEFARYAFYVQSVLNFYRRRIKICDEEIKRLVGHLLDRSIYGMEEKWLDAIARDPHARRWQAIRNKAYRALTTIEEYPARLHQMSRSAGELCQSRRQSYGKI